jgi:hypothetical protein
MNIRTTHVCPPIPVRNFDWLAVDDDTYDGAPDSGTRNQIGFGRTEDEAIADLKEKLGDGPTA